MADNFLFGQASNGPILHHFSRHARHSNIKGVDSVILSSQTNIQISSHPPQHSNDHKFFIWRLKVRLEIWKKYPKHQKKVNPSRKPDKYHDTSLKCIVTLNFILVKNVKFVKPWQIDILYICILYIVYQYSMKIITCVCLFMSNTLSDKHWLPKQEGHNSSLSSWLWATSPHPAQKGNQSTTNLRTQTDMGDQHPKLIQKEKVSMSISVDSKVIEFKQVWNHSFQ